MTLRWFFESVLCGSIDTEALARDRDQLWAEAKQRHSAGEKWWLDTSALVELAAEEQTARYQGDPWEEVIAPWLEVHTSTSVSEVLEKCLSERHGTANSKRRYGFALRLLINAGFVRYESDSPGSCW